MLALIQQNRNRRATRKNQYASNDDKTIRLGVSILPKLVDDLEGYCQTNLHEKLWKNDKELQEFMFRFPMFRVAEKV
jgi:hypothetical protein